MTIEEMHIDFDIRLAQLGSNVGDYLSPEKKDWLLNNAVYDKLGSLLQSYKNQGIGFDDTVYRNDITQNLVSQIVVPFSKYDNSTSFVNLPSDYFSGFKGQVGVSNVCAAPTFSYSTKKYDVVLATFDKDFNSEAGSESFVNFKIIVDTDVVEGASNIVSNTVFGPISGIYQNGVDYDISYFINTLIQQFTTDATLEIYQGQYGTYVHRKGLIFVRPQDDRKIVKFQYYYAPEPAGFEKVEFTVNTVEVEEIVSVEDLVYKNMDTIPYELASIVNENPFSRSEREYSKCEIRNNRVFVRHDSRYVPYTLKGVYIRNPRLMIYDLGVNSELGLGTNRYRKICQDVVAAAVAKAAIYTEATNAEVLNIDSINKN